MGNVPVPVPGTILYWILVYLVPGTVPVVLTLTSDQKLITFPPLPYRYK